jgi:hypothetical protein
MNNMVSNSYKYKQSEVNSLSSMRGNPGTNIIMNALFVYYETATKKRQVLRRR